VAIEPVYIAWLWFLAMVLDYMVLGYMVLGYMVLGYMVLGYIVLSYGFCPK
jgi:hypothetical protein